MEDIRDERIAKAEEGLADMQEVLDQAKRAVDAAPESQAVAWRHRHLLDVDGLSGQEIDLVMRTTDAMREVLARPIAKVPALRGRQVTILFCDLVASTERRARLGDDAFDAFTARFMQMLRGTVTQWGGREVSSAGDGLMVVFRESVADSIECATEMHRAVRDLDADDPPRLRIGVSTGEVAQDGTDYSGMPIVEAARLEAAAAPGQTLANAVVRALVGNRRSLHFRDIGALTLRVVLGYGEVELR